MLQGARSNQFRFNFPKAFVPTDVANRYDPYLNSVPGNMVKRSIDLLNYSIQSINFPAAEFDPVAQRDKPGIQRQYRASLPKQELFAKTLEVTFKLFDGFINYWMLFDTFDYYYSPLYKGPYIPEGMRLQLYDGNGNVIVSAEMRRVIFQSIGSLDLSYSENSPDAKTFTCTFVYNELFTKVELD